MLYEVITAEVPAKALYKLRKTPARQALYTYFAAIIRVTGMDQGNVYPLKKFLGNFSGHVNEGRIQKVSGGYQLTRKGIDYFNDSVITSYSIHYTKLYELYLQSYPQIV